MAIDLELMLQYSRQLQQATSLDELVAATRDAVSRGTRFRTSWVMAFADSPEGEFAHVLAASGAGESIIWNQTTRFPVANDLMLQELKQGRRPVIMEDCQTDHRVNREVVREGGHRTAVNVPMILGDALLGSLGAGTFRDEGVLVPTADEVATLTIIATQCAAALARVRLLSEKRRSEARAEALEGQRADLEAQLRHSQKLEAIGTLAGGIAHDFNNLLAVITGNLGLLEGEPVSESARSSLADIAIAAHRATDLVRQILVFSRRHPVARSPAALGPIIEEALRLLRATLPTLIELRFEDETDGAFAVVDATQINQVLMNLGTNAWHAIGSQPGAITFSLSVVEATAAHRIGTLSPGRWVGLRVTDTGSGMPPAVVEHLFEPFFTTKEVGRGSGLGLSVVHGIVREHGGDIACQTAPGAGTTFTIYLPEAAATEVAATARPDVDASQRARIAANVLYLDDEDLIGRVTVRALSKLGYSATAYTRASQALAAVRADPSAFDVVITDFNMPGMSGLAVLDRVHEIRADLPVLIVSGFVDSSNPDWQRLDARRVLQKPFDAQALDQAIQKALAVTPRPPPGPALPG